MPYTAQHKVESRNRILASAFKLFSLKGYDNVSINEIMADANLTRGGFYAHFDNKSKLYHEAIIYAAEHSEITRRKPDAMDTETWIQYLLRGYLHKKNLTNSSHCPLASLATDVAVRDPEVRQAYTNTYKGMNNILVNYIKSYSSCSKDTVMATTAMIIGGLAIARALDDRKLAERLLDNCRTEALRLLNGG
ncbi:TetR/AcrR family transcriptional regulator [Kaarinaea lacus]